MHDGIDDGPLSFYIDSGITYWIDCDAAVYIGQQ